MAKVKTKYAITAFTTLVTKPGEILSDEDLIKRLVKALVDEEDAKAIVERGIKDGVIEVVEGEPEPEKEPEEEPATEPESVDEPEPEPAPKRRPGRPKKTK